MALITLPFTVTQMVVDARLCTSHDWCVEVGVVGAVVCVMEELGLVRPGHPWCPRRQLGRLQS